MPVHHPEFKEMNDILLSKYNNRRNLALLKHKDLMKLLPLLPDTEKQFYLALKLQTEQQEIFYGDSMVHS
jgi:hypothetical protein